MAQCGMRHRFEKNVALQNGENEGDDEISEAEMLHKKTSVLTA